jgi:hypothetical protein
MKLVFAAATIEKVLNFLLIFLPSQGRLSVNLRSLAKVRLWLCTFKNLPRIIFVIKKFKKNSKFSNYHPMHVHLWRRQLKGPMN